MARPRLEARQPIVVHEEAVELVVERPGHWQKTRPKALCGLALDQIGAVPGKRPDIGVEPVSPDPHLRHWQLGADAVEADDVPMVGHGQGCIEAFEEVVVEHHVVLEHQRHLVRGGEDLVPHPKM